MPDTPGRPIARALVSVSDKTGLEVFVSALASRGVEVLSTGGTARVLRDAGIAVTDVSDHTGFPEIMGGRVKTLHPAIHGGILARRDDAQHRAAMEAHGIAGIDLVVVNLYPFEEAVRDGAALDTCIETIDIGGPAMIRAAAKNHEDVTVVVQPSDYRAVLDDMEATSGATSLALRRRLAATAFARTAVYDAAIARRLGAESDAEDNRLPNRFAFGGARRQVLRYGENPHQTAALYVDPTAPPGVAQAALIQGKEPSYNNLADADAAFGLVREFTPPAIAIIKHGNPCGVGLGGSLAGAYEKARACDPVSAFGGVVAANRPLDGATARLIAGLFTEVVVAPEADDEARAVLAAKSDLRLLLTGSRHRRRSRTAHGPHSRRRIPGADSGHRAGDGGRAQDRDQARADGAGTRGPPVRLHCRQAREVERHRLRQGTAPRSASAQAR